MALHNYSLTPARQKKLFMFSYYNRPLLGYARRFLGPLMLLEGFLCVLFQIGGIVTPVICFSAGVYFIIRPLILLAKTNFRGTSMTIDISDQAAEFGDASGSFIIKKDEIEEIRIIKKRILYRQLFIFS